MKSTIKHLFKSLIAGTFFFSLLFSQNIDIDGQMFNDLRDVVEAASRAGKDVFVEDFTGLE